MTKERTARKRERKTATREHRGAPAPEMQEQPVLQEQEGHPNFEAESEEAIPTVSTPDGERDERQMV